ncbi:MAG: hypothetical protein HPY50_15745 [Firmicutes bacterium]|nr:hypothetical protein [Bacillota bacterium]
MRTIRWTARLFVIHVLFILLVAEGTYFQGLDLVFSLFYLVILWQAGKAISDEFEARPWLNLIIVGTAYQLPGYAMTVINLLYYNGKQGIAADFTYGFQLWHTPLLPFLSLHTFPLIGDFISYFVALFFLSPFYLLVMIAPFASRRSRASLAGKTG